MGKPLFAYGTLMYPSVISKVIGRVPENHPGLVRGYRRLGVEGESFPGLLPGGSAPVAGLVYHGLSDEEWRLLTAYEDTFYVLEKIVVENGKDVLEALVYLVPPENQHLLSREHWQPRAELL